MKPGRELLREAREKKGLSTRDLGQKISKNHSLIVRWEMGTRQPDINDAFLLWDTLGVPVASWRTRKRVAKARASAAA